MDCSIQAHEGLHVHAFSQLCHDPINASLKKCPPDFDNNIVSKLSEQLLINTKINPTTHVPAASSLFGMGGMAVGILTAFAQGLLNYRNGMREI